MTVTVHIDGCPYRVSFTGRIEIARCWDSPDVAVRLASDDATVEVQLDEGALGPRLRMFEDIERRMNSLPGLVSVTRPWPWEDVTVEELERAYRESQEGR